MPKKPSEEVKIEKGLPVPKRGRWPLKDMKIGDSFFVPESDKKAVINSIYPLAQRRQIKIAVRSVEGGKRVWRTA